MMQFLNTSPYKDKDQIFFFDQSTDLRICRRELFLNFGSKDLEPIYAFNRFKTCYFQEPCSSRAKMDLKAIAEEIAEEAERKPR